MNPTLVHEIETMFQAPAAPSKLKCAAPLEIAACMLRSPASQTTATTVVGVLGCDDVDAFHALVAEIGSECGLDAAVTIRQGSYAVRFSRLTETIIH